MPQSHLTNIRPSSQSNQRNCFLLRLPPELRTAIYPYLFASISLQKVKSKEEYIVTQDGNALLSTCRQVYSEALPYRSQASTFSVYASVDEDFPLGPVLSANSHACKAVKTIRASYAGLATLGVHAGLGSDRMLDLFPALNRVVVDEEGKPLMVLKKGT